MLSFINFLKRLWIFVKTYWQLLVAGLGAIVGFLLLRRSEQTFSERYKKLQDAHDAEIKKIDAARLEERAAHDANLKKLQDALNAVQAQYDAAKKQLDDSKKKEIADIVKAYSDRPDELARKLSESTGFQIILPGA